MSSELTRQPVVEVAGVGKQYRYGAGAEGRLADAIAGAARRLAHPSRRRPRETFWALRDVSIEVGQGEVVGVIGRNGAGKSTLLKLLAKITLPTEGRIVMHGRVASLLEVGAGFDPELTGRENVFLSGAILGMRGKEIANKFDEIVEFSGIERFIDTPVKRYSSGMFVRLAFAVGAHLESDILLIDEVLAVGDAEFQRKCFGKMESVSEQGRTIIFVSHNLVAVQRICQRAYLLDAGQVAADGPTGTVVTHYLDMVGAQQNEAQIDVSELIRPGSGAARLQRITFLDPAGQPTDRLLLGQLVTVEFSLEAVERIPDAIFQLGISNAEGARIVTSHSTDAGHATHELDPGRHRVRVSLDAGLLPGDFLLDVGVYHSNEIPIDHLDGALRFRVLNVSDDGEDRYPLTEVRGHVRAPSTWSVGDTAPV
jgi:lipopolysaccharide transport system ATP-binding protein